MSVNSTLLLAAGLSVSLLLAGCGIKPTQLEPPPGSDPAEVRDPAVKTPPPPDGVKPDKPFILDGLLM
ncbi:hypothetical protein [Microbaculum marinum]|uniref:Lipoprotein n=1 Tax=Microbaculum marinum TaxID=1764581 RepID=A0AAW9S5P0_9HYPH